MVCGALGNDVFRGAFKIIFNQLKHVLLFQTQMHVTLFVKIVFGETSFEFD